MHKMRKKLRKNSNGQAKNGSVIYTSESKRKKITHGNQYENCREILKRYTGQN